MDLCDGRTGLVTKGPAGGRTVFERLGARLLIAVVLLGLALISSPSRSAQDLDEFCAQGVPDGCFEPGRFDIGFLIDRTGSVGLRGQTYNIQLNGLARALRDPSIIPTNGSIAMAVITFSETGTVNIPLTEINSPADAEALARQVEALRCPTIGALTPPCPFGATNYGAGILTADVHLNQNRRQGANRILLMSTDGQASENAVIAARAQAIQSRNAALTLGIQWELDAIMIGLGEEELDEARQRVEQFVIPEPTSTLPGASFVVDAGSCNLPEASPSEADCTRQARDYAAIVREILLRGLETIELIVATADDTPPGVPTTGPLSLRAAIEEANCRGGRTVIRFSEELFGETISPLSPLPAITAPEIVIDGCTDDDCEPAVTIDGSEAEVSSPGETPDGILIRTNRVVVRGLRIVNFARSGIAIAPLCPLDLVGSNLVERNVLVDNVEAGVLVLDPPSEPDDQDMPDPPDGVDFLTVGTNVGNRISANQISGSATLIDLGGDGPTPNDPDDADDGPNRLINFPESMTVAFADDVLTASGVVDGPAAVNSTVEVFGVTAFAVEDGVVVIQGITFLAATITDEEGLFTVEIPESETGLYTATVTDTEDNTSEVMFETDTTVPPRPVVTVTAMVNFGDNPLNTPSAPREVLVSNDGNAPLSISACAIARCDIDDPDQTGRFTIDECPIQVLNPGEEVTIEVTFTPNQCGPVRACLILTTNDPIESDIPTILTGQGAGAAQAIITLQGGGSALDFGRTAARPRPRSQANAPNRNFSIQNGGCEPLSLTFASLRRIGADVNLGRIANPDDTRFFSASIVNPNGTETPINIGLPLTIGPGQTSNFRVRFNPVIPAVVSPGAALSAGDVLPDTVTSRLTINQMVGGPLTVDLVARVRTPVRLIHPTDPRNSPLVVARRQGNELTVDFSAYDSNLSVNRAVYEFLDGAGRLLGPPIDINLSSSIQQSNLVRGQSFTVTHRFASLFRRPQVASVRVTVFDGETSDTATSSGVQ